MHLANSAQSHFHKCSTQFPEIGCEMFANDMSKSASTMSLSILVVIEMFNAMNALSSSESLMTFPLWKNMKLVYAIILSMALHFAILYVPFLQGLFSIVPLNWTEWQAVVAISAPVMYVIPAYYTLPGHIANKLTVLSTRSSSLQSVACTISPPTRLSSRTELLGSPRRHRFWVMI